MDHDTIICLARQFHPTRAQGLRLVGRMWRAAVDNAWPRGLISYLRAIRLARRELVRHIKLVRDESERETGEIYYWFRGREVVYVFYERALMMVMNTTACFYINWDSGSMRPYCASRVDDVVVGKVRGGMIYPREKTRLIESYGCPLL